MNPSSYKTIEQIVENARALPADTPVSVPVGSLKDIFGITKRALRCQGILGFAAEGHPILNDIGMAVLVRSVAKDEFGHLGEMISCNVSSKAWSLEWKADMVFAAPNGTSINITRSYSLSYLEERRKFKYEMP